MSSRLALLLANVRYWSTVAPLVRARLGEWERRAQAIGDPLLRGLALSSLEEGRFNVEAATTLATLADPIYRRGAVEAIVALQVAYDYLDLLTERPPGESPGDDRDLFGALTDALTPGERSDGDCSRHARPQDGGYLRELVQTVRVALASLPAAHAIGAVALRSATRCAQAQACSHAAARAGTAELVAWATREAAHTDNLRWQEFLAGATASVLTVHALIGAAGNPRTTRRDAEAIDAAYLPICALSMLDSLLDREQDAAAGQLNYADLYDSPEQMATRLAGLARDARSRVRALPDAAHHLVTLTGVVAYYASAPAARGPRAAPVMIAVRAELRPLIAPTLALMRTWRLAKWWRSALAAGVSS
jgi:tetraprenyl-beta-curcumene synthase